MLKGQKHTIESKQKMSITRKGRGLGEENPFYGKKHSLESSIKMSMSGKGHIAWNKGKSPSQETIEKNRISHLGKKCSEEVKRKMSISQKIRRSKVPKVSRKVYKQRRKAMKKLGGILSINTIRLVYEDNIKKYGTLTCYLCLKPIEFKKDTLEHKIPLSRGGTNYYDNLEIACNTCNCRKNKKTHEEYLKWVEVSRGEAI